ncbi:MAG: alpha/beta hydrolase family protein [Candidatus Sericytochromatia bacterium]
MESLAQVLASNGVAVLSIDLGGYGDSEPGPDTLEAHRESVLSALLFLRQQHLVNPQQLALVGHSLGALAVIEAAQQDGHISTVLALGMHPSDEWAKPPVWITGRHDLLHPPEGFAGQPVWVSPTAHHQSELHDWGVLEQVQNHLQDVWDLDNPKVSAGVVLGRLWLSQLAFGALWALGWSLLPAAVGWGHRGAWLVMTGAFVGAGYLGWADPRLCAHAVVLLLAIWWGRFQALWPLLGLLALLTVSREMVALLRLLPQPQLWLEALMLWPLQLLQSASAYALGLLQGLEQVLFVKQSPRLEPHFIGGVLVATEVLFPHGVERLLAGAQRLKGLRSPQLGGLSVLLLLILGGCLGAVLIWRGQQGYLQVEALWALGRMAVLEGLPVLVLTAASLWIWQKKRPRDDSNIRPTV